MKLHSWFYFANALLGATAVSAPALAVPIGAGTVSVADQYVPTVNLASSPATYTALFGDTFQVLGTGAFTGVTGLTGLENGTLMFSNLVGTTLSQTVNNFFQFSDGSGGNYSFTTASVTTQTYNVNPGVTSSISLYVLGSTSDLARGLTATPTSLTMSFNNTGASPFSSSATLAIPPANSSAVAEPASWGLMIVGLGLTGAALRRRKRTVRFGNRATIQV